MIEQDLMYSIQFNQKKPTYQQVKIRVREKRKKNQVRDISLTSARNFWNAQKNAPHARDKHHLTQYKPGSPYLNKSLKLHTAILLCSSIDKMHAIHSKVIDKSLIPSRFWQTPNSQTTCSNTFSLACWPVKPHLVCGLSCTSTSTLSRPGPRPGPD